MRGRHYLPLAAVGLLAACATTKIDPNVDAYGMPNAELALQRSMDRVGAAMSSLGGMTVGYRAASVQPPVVPAELQRPLSFAWSGPIDTGAKALADRIGYKLVVTKPTNAAPITVGLNMTNTSAIDLFRAMGEAAGSQATVIVDPDHQQVLVQHHV